MFVPDDDVVGAVNDGWTVARSTLGNERVSIGGSSGGLFRSMDLLALLERAGDRVPGASARVGAALSTEHALKLLNLRRAQRAVVGAGPGPEGNVTKLVLAEHGHVRARLQGDLVGPAVAFLEGEDALAGNSELATRAMSIAGGTSEITRNQIAERILGLPRDPLITVTAACAPDAGRRRPPATMSPGPMRVLRGKWSRIIALVLAVLVIAFVVLTVVLFVKPELNAPERADAVVVLGGPNNNVPHEGVRLVEHGYAPTVAFSLAPGVPCVSAAVNRSTPRPRRSASTPSRSRPRARPVPSSVLPPCTAGSGSSW